MHFLHYRKSSYNDSNNTYETNTTKYLRTLQYWQKLNNTTTSTTTTAANDIDNDNDNGNDDDDDDDDDADVDDDDDDDDDEWWWWWMMMMNDDDDDDDDSRKRPRRLLCYSNSRFWETGNTDWMITCQSVNKSIKFSCVYAIT